MSKRSTDTQDNTPDINAIRARGYPKEASKVFASRGWNVLPENERGERILRWGVDIAWTAVSTNPERSFRRWCRKWAPWAKESQLIAYVRRSNKNWTPDQSATVLEITISDRATLSLRFFGANDDPDYEIRRDIRKARNAECQRHRRAANSTGRKPGRPALELSSEQKRARCNAQTAKRMGLMRLRKTPSPDIKNIDRVTQFSVTQPSPKPWKLLGMKRSTYFLRKKAGKLPRPPVEMPTIRTNPIDLSKFGIIAIRVMRGTDVIRAWDA